MADMIDTYLASTDEAALRQFLSFFSQVIGPVRGREAVPEGVDENGNIVAAQPAMGDPAKVYACVRAPFAVSPAFLPQGVEVVDNVTGAEVAGVWA